MYDIYSFSDPYVLNKVFNSIALIFNDGVYLTIAAAVILLGYLFASFKSLSNGAKDIPVVPVIVAIILFSMGFQTKDTVLIHNRFTSQITHVDNIPIAIAFPAHFISKLGHVFLQKYEAAFNVQDEQKISKHGFLTPMKMLAELRQDTVILREKAQALSNINNINFDRSMRQYATDCIAIKGISTSTVGSLREQDITSVIDYNSSAHSTTIYRNGGGETIYTCNDAYDILKPLITIASEKIAKITLQHQSYNLIKENNTVDGGLNVNNKITQYLKAVDHDYTNNRGFTQSLLLSSYLDDGMLAYYSSLGASDLHENLTSSIAQRNQVWIMQGELWSDIVFDILSILECMIYALTPFIGLGLLLGSFGMKMFVTYVQIIAIIHIFPILMTITSSLLYEEISIFSRMLVLKYDSGSLAYMENLTAKAYELMAYGGMISSTLLPVIAIAIVTGSAMGLGSALKGLAAAAPKDTDAVAQTVSQQSAITDQGINKSQTYSSETGGVSKWTLDRMPKFTDSDSWGKAVSDSEAKVKTTENALQKAQSQALTQLNSETYNDQIASTLGNSVLDSDSKRASLVQDATKGISNKWGLSENEAASVASVLALQATAKAQGGFFAFGNGAGAGIDGRSNVSTNGQSGFSKNYAKARDEALQLAKSNAFSDEFQDATKADLTSGKSLTNTDSILSKVDDTVSKSYKESESAKKEYSEVEQLSKDLKATSATEIMPWIANNYDGETKSQVNSYVDSLSSQDKEVFFKNLNNLDRNDNIHNNDHKTMLAAMLTADTLNHGDALLDMASGKDVGNIQDNTGVDIADKGLINTTYIPKPSDRDIPSRETIESDYGKNENNVNNQYDNNITNEKRGESLESRVDGEINKTTESMHDAAHTRINASNAHDAVEGAMGQSGTLFKTAHETVSEAGQQLHSAVRGEQMVNPSPDEPSINPPSSGRYSEIPESKENEPVTIPKVDKFSQDLKENILKGIEPINSLVDGENEHVKSALKSNESSIFDIN